ncbi:MAG TPA: glycosyltransferase family 39 protein [Verrucomicrobiae bacterium]|nr:glycosyltransferase family 39 protein [Verrucomicrobiae bacterium]
MAAALLVSMSLHFWNIGTMPPGFYLDESSNAYNAYCIACTGADEYGTAFPVFFRCFDDYHDPVMIYFLAPWVKTLGLKPAVARFPSALFALLASILFSFLVFRFTNNRWLSLLSGLGFSILPWIFVVSRIITGGYTAMLCGMILGWLLLDLALDHNSPSHAAGAGVAWAFAMYSHNIGRPMTALLLLAFAAAYSDALKSKWRIGLAAAGAWLLALVPMMVSVARSPVALTSRFQRISVFGDRPSWTEAASRIASRYVEYFSPQFLFLRGDSNLRHHSGHGGELFLFLIPMVLAGLYCVARYSWTSPRHRFLGLGLLLYPAAATLTTDHMHSGRSINGAIFWAVTAVIGADFLWRKGRVGRTLLLACCLAGVVEAPLYFNDYFGDYQVRTRPEFQAAFTGALADCFRALGEEETLYVSGSVLGSLTPPANWDFQPFCYADILFFGRIDPRAYLSEGIPKDRVCPYRGVIQKPGLLLRCNLWLVRPGGAGRPPEFKPNDEPIPPETQLVRVVPVAPLMQYEIYRIRRP